MIHMLSAFNLGESQTIEDFKHSYALFVDDLQKLNLIAKSGPIGERVTGTPMDTDDERHQRYYSILSFRDRAQLDAAYAYIASKSEPGMSSHLDMHGRVADGVFTCWRDVF